MCARFSGISAGPRPSRLPAAGDAGQLRGPRDRARPACLHGLIAAQAESHPAIAPSAHWMSCAGSDTSPLFPPTRAMVVTEPNPKSTPSATATSLAAPVDAWALITVPVDGKDAR